MIPLLFWTGAAIAASSPPVDVYGFARLDLSYDHSRLTHPQYFGWALPEPSGDGNHSELDINARLSRVGLRAADTPFGPWVVRGLIEFDFQNGGSESQPLPRGRHLYGEAQHGNLSVLTGQTWQLAAPLFPTGNADGMTWNAGNLGDRAPQLRLSWTPEVGDGKMRWAAAASATGAVDAQDLDGDGRRDGLDAAQPTAQALGELSMPLWNERPMTIGAWGHTASARVNTPIAGTDQFQSWAAGGHLYLPLTRVFALQGEAFWGQALSDIRGGISQSVNARGTEIRSWGGWAEAVVEPTSTAAIFMGGGLDDPVDGDLDTGGRTYNQALWMGARVRVLPPVTVGVEAAQIHTRYANSPDGEAVRVGANVTTRFGR